MEEERLTAARLSELAETCYARGIYTESEFLGLGEQDVLHRMARELSYVPYTLFGGTEGCERVLVRFGNEEMLGYPPPPYPIATLAVTPRAPKFAEPLTHRDLLGALMSLGIRRECLGDILIEDGRATIFVLEKLSAFVCEGLSRVRHTEVQVHPAEPPPLACVRTEEISVQVASLRLDAILAAVHRLSRADSSALFAERRVFVDGRLIIDGSTVAPLGSMLTVRGLGRVRLFAVTGSSRKGRTHLTVQRFL